ncbi:MAG TPA: hypothetical protein VFM37_00285 [Pseudonocardiaceae bacterium]|nr:hypothetical protein [Pseudonocardiaceae bacterium]
MLARLTAITAVAMLVAALGQASAGPGSGAAPPGMDVRRPWTAPVRPAIQVAPDAAEVEDMVTKSAQATGGHWATTAPTASTCTSSRRRSTATATPRARLVPALPFRQLELVELGA